jgi:hypothetical protein
MKLWEKGINPEPAIIEFTAGRQKNRSCPYKMGYNRLNGACYNAGRCGLISEDEKNDLA